MAETKAKKKIETEEIKTENPAKVTAPESMKTETKQYMKPKDEYSINEMSISDLMDYRKACVILRDYYGNSVKLVDHDYEAVEFQKKFDRFNGILSAIMGEIEERLNKLKKK